MASNGLLISLLFIGANCYADNSLKQQFVQKNGLIPRDGYVPKRGFVPDVQTAISIGIAVLIPIYGQDVIDAQKPFEATLIGDVWVVTGTLKRHTPGGVAEIDISRKTGTILRVIHGK
jgi:hypothetical protein